jgi:hypothetical protein
MNFQIGDQVTTPEGPGVVCWVTPKRYSVRLYDTCRTIKVQRNQVAAWPPRKDGSA